ncbi:hypothetical protein [Pseudomonas sp. 39167]|uniref:hypothetical protein n=1 Tax=Pseudomonas sp. 39167 TaxID=2967215 RepID=UPI002363D17A|nr:hypothetical protein [Pseudomonas sp. 39167]
MSLMAFAEISTRIGGEVTLIDATLLLGFFHSHARSPHMPTLGCPSPADVWFSLRNPEMGSRSC